MNLLNILISIAFAVGELIVLYPKQDEVFQATDKYLEIPLVMINDIIEPSLLQLHNMTVSLCTGPNKDITLVRTITTDLTLQQFKQQGSESDASWQYNFKLDPDFTSDGLYYLQIVAFYDKQYVIHYSTRFQVLNMTNQTEFNWGSMQSPPETITIYPGMHSTSSSQLSIDEASYTIPPELQTGSIRYAPMQPLIKPFWNPHQWVNTISKVSQKPFKSLQPQTQVEFTVTQPPTYTIVSGANTQRPMTTSQQWYNPQKRILTPYLRKARSHS